MTRFEKGTGEITEQLWHDFVTSVPHSEKEKAAFAAAKKVLRPMVFQSWLLSKRQHIDPFTPKTDVLPEAQLTKILAANKLLIDVSMSYLESLYSFLDESHFSLIITDAKGITLAIVGGTGSNSIESLREKDGVDIGMDRSTQYNGTNGVGLCLDEKKPVQLTGLEHYVSSQRSWAASAAPLYDNTGSIIGTIAIFGLSDMLNPHTLGMAVSAADGIKKELALLQKMHHLSVLNKQLEHTLQFTTSGIIMVDEKLIIRQHNHTAKAMLHLEHAVLNGKPIGRILPVDKNILDYEEVLRHSKQVQNREVPLPDSSAASINVNIAPITNENGESNGFVMAMQTMKQIHKIAANVYGSSATFSFDSIIGSSPSLLSCKKMGLIASQSASNLLILGESGTGKELFAQAVHNASSRADGPFIPVNCASLPKQLIESELFGYAGGAFTGASKNGRIGKFELANGGTIFLDEIGDMPLDVQASLLRVLQSREITRIGSGASRPIDVRVIAATNHNLSRDVDNQLFRGDLFYRLNVLLLTIPPLRKRIDDVPLLAESFAEKYAKALNKPYISISSEAIDALTSYYWPGNVRELENVIERAINITSGASIQLHDLPAELLHSIQPQQTQGELYEQFAPSQWTGSPQAQTQGTIVSGPDPHIGKGTLVPDGAANAVQSAFAGASNNVSALQLRTQERQSILCALAETNGNVKKAAELLGISRKTMYNKVHKLQIDVEIYRKG